MQNQKQLARKSCSSAFRLAQRCRSSVIGIFLALAAATAAPSAQASTGVAQGVGVIATSSFGPMGQPPASPARDLDTGVEVYFKELISTDTNGQAQLLFQDGTALTVGPDSDLVIDQYVYDPASGLGNMTIDISNGVFRLVGGRISKNNPITFITPSSNVTIRGGVFTGTVTESKTDLVLLFGELQVTLASGEASRTTVPGTNITASISENQLGSLSRKPVEPERLTSLNKTLEKSVNQNSVAETSNLTQTPATATATTENTDRGQIDLAKTNKESSGASLLPEAVVAASEERSTQPKEEAKQVRKASSAAIREARKQFKERKAALKKAREERRKERKAAGKTPANDSADLSRLSKKQQKKIVALASDLSVNNSAPVPDPTTPTLSRDSKEIAETGIITSKSETGTDAPIVTDIDEEGDPIIGCDSEADCASVTLFSVDDKVEDSEVGDDGDDTESTSTNSDSGAVIVTSKPTKKEKKAAKKKKKAAVAKKKAAKAAAKKAKAKKKAAAKAAKKKKKEAKAAAKKKAA